MSSDIRVTILDNTEFFVAYKSGNMIESHRAVLSRELGTMFHETSGPDEVLKQEVCVAMTQLLGENIHNEFD